MGLKMIIKNAQEAFVFNDQVVDLGLRRDIDYTWRYTPAVNSWLGDEVITPATVEFDFVDKRWETYFQLRWIKT
jgi:hypothetical protein